MIRLAALLLLSAATVSAQQPAPPPTQAQAPDLGTDIWLARLTPDGAIEAPINITARPGYDNQPSFTPDGKGILFTRRDGDQTDIYLWDFSSRTSEPTRVTRTPESEYSPNVTPDGQGVSVIRVEPDGTQRLWRFPLQIPSPSPAEATNASRAQPSDASPRPILRNVKPVGYHAWGPDGLLALFVLGNPNTLQVADSRTGRARVVTQRIGRSVHRIPGRDTISVLHQDATGPWIKELDVRTRTLKPIVRAVESKEGDYAWTSKGAILMSDGKRLMRWQAGDDWTAVADLAALGLEGASRMAVSPDGSWLAMVVPDAR